MASPNQRRRSSSQLPEMLRPLFWDYRFSKLNWDEDIELITARVLAVGDWDAVRWLRRRLGDNGLRQWLERRRGAGLSRRQLRFWELILHLSRRKVNSWLAQKGRQIWDRRR